MRGGLVAESSLTASLLKRIQSGRCGSDAQGLLRLWLCSCSAEILWFTAVRSSSPPAARLLPLTTYPGVEGPPSLSPDGNQVAFERNGDIFVEQVTAKRSRNSRARPSRNRRRLGPQMAVGLRSRAPATESSSSRQAAAPARLAYQRLVEDLDIRRAEIVGEATPEHRLRSSQPFISSTSSEDHPRYSPDGTKIAFVSRRSGTQEIWVCAGDASNPVRLTSMRGPIVVGPQWSPDGDRIAFFATTGAAGRYVAYVTGAEDGRTSRLTRTEGELEALPAWSRDGRWVYLASGRSGSLQIWSVPLDSGEPVQITRGGGAEASESPDGRIVYYTKVPEIGPGLWSVPVGGGDEVRVLDSVRFGYWAVARNGIYFIDFDVPSDAARPVRFFNFESRQLRQVGTVENTVAWSNTPGFAISPDGRWLLYSSLERSDADLMLLDNFR